MEIEQRIANFKNMTDADPENELGHFSLGKAYADAQRYEEACVSFQRVIELQSGFSKAYQHLGEALKSWGKDSEAVAALMDGYRVAAERGDVMPRDAMAGLLRELGQTPPEVETKAPAAAATPASGDTVSCCHCNQNAPKMDERPFKGELGETVLAHVCEACWKEWIGMGTKVINELQLDFSNPQAGETYNSHMIEFLQLPT